jgi:hypothetical protein
MLLHVKVRPALAIAWTGGNDALNGGVCHQQVCLMFWKFPPQPAVPPLEFVVQFRFAPLRRGCPQTIFP